MFSYLKNFVVLVTANSFSNVLAIITFPVLYKKIGNELYGKKTIKKSTIQFLLSFFYFAYFVMQNSAKYILMLFKFLEFLSLECKYGIFYSLLKNDKKRFSK